MNFEQLSSELAQTIQQFHLPACGVGISSHGQTFTQGYGTYDPDWVFPIASISKSFLATTICRLADAKILDLDQPIQQAWSDFQMFDEHATKSLTWRDLLSHRSGLPAHDLMRFTNGPLTLAQVAQKVRYLKPNVDVRYRMQYNNLMFGVLTYALEQVLGTDYYTYLQENLLDLLQLKHTYVHDERSLAPIAPPYFRFTQGRKKITFMSPGHLGGASSMLSMPEDLLAWSQFHLYNYQKHDANNLAQMYKPQVVMTPSRPFAKPQFSAYGFGMMMETYRGYKYFYHSGSFIGYCAMLGFVPDLDLSFVMLTNMDSTNATFAVPYQIIDAAAGLDKVDWSQKIRYIERQNKAQQKAKEQAQFGDTKFEVASHSRWLGTYQHPGYGTIELRDYKGQLVAKFGTMTCAVVQDLKGKLFIDAPLLHQLIALKINNRNLQLLAEPALGTMTTFEKI
ncbi:serine hydrolase [Bombilactobacillus folatiphilus]|uniref:Serine hydrolase n=1 Tax=Bombilactobacillus folatiphilus TaxID=2923362 RepID=A0ABY4P7Y1_9LACO|nr:serine hydrolase [Bombilactobacillus folatiphilus]UQS81762.1 serine hydrolase [Bombilactobacillus folatiphilus]